MDEALKTRLECFRDVLFQAMQDYVYLHSWTVYDDFCDRFPEIDDRDQIIDVESVEKEEHLCWSNVHDGYKVKKETCDCG